MTDILDCIYSDSSSLLQMINPEEIYCKFLFEKLLHYQKWTRSQTSISWSLHEQNNIECYQRFIPFSSDLFWNYKLLLLIKHHPHQILTEIKIISPKGEVLKVISQYHRTFLYRRFLQRNNSVTGKINPQTGQISLCTAFSLYKVKDPRNYQLIALNLLNSVLQNKAQIKEIIKLIQNKQQSVKLLQNEQNTTNIPAFMRLCCKKSNKQNKVPFQETYEVPAQQRRKSKCKTYGGDDGIDSKPRHTKAKQMAKYLNNPLQSINQIWEYDNLNLESQSFRKQVKNILSGVQNSLVRKGTPLKNYQVIKLPQKHYQSLQTSIKCMKSQHRSKQITKLQKTGYGKLTVQIQIKQLSQVEKTYKFLSTLPQQLQMSFINNYFSCDDFLDKQQSNDVIIQLAIRRQELLSYLESNSHCISFSTKLRILSQLISSVFLLQKTYSSMMSQMCLDNFSIAKNMMIKINNLEYLKNLTQEQKMQFQSEIKLGFVENQVNITRIYSKLFYQKELIYFKPSKGSNRLRLSHIFSNSKIEEKSVIIDKIYEECGFYGPKKLMALLTCIFIPYIPMVSFEQIKNNPSCKNLKWGIASLIKILENTN